MNRQCLEPCTITYLDKFYCIFDKMMRGMTGAALSCSISYNFIVQMIPHHQAAIAMSQNILQYTTNRSLQEIAAGIVAEQTKSIEDMEKIMDFCSGYENAQEELCIYLSKVNAIMNRMFHKMSHACATNQVNCDFMREMIPHHEGAVEMSKTTLQFGICPQLVTILDAIISSQERGIIQMQNLMKCLGCEP